MKRKLVKQGASTMMISLPSKWIKANKLGKGDEIDLEESGNNLIIGSKLKGKKETLEIKINTENKADIRNLLTHAYRKGFNKLKISGIDSSIVKEIRSITSNLLLGFELTQIEKDFCIIESISEPTDDKYEIMLKKVFTIIRETQDIILEDFKNEKPINIKEISEIKNQHDKFILFCRRIILENNNVSEWELLTFLMHIEHAYYYMYKYTAENKVKPGKHILELLEEQKRYFNLLQTAYQSKSIQSIHRINQEKSQFQFGKCLLALEKSKGKEIVILSYIREIFRLIQTASSPILNEILDL